MARKDRELLRASAQRLSAQRRAGVAPHPADSELDAERAAWIEHWRELVHEAAPALHGDFIALRSCYLRLSRYYRVPPRARQGARCAADHLYFAMQDLGNAAGAMLDAERATTGVQEVLA